MNKKYRVIKISFCILLFILLHYIKILILKLFFSYFFVLLVINIIKNKKEVKNDKKREN